MVEARAKENSTKRNESFKNRSELQTSNMLLLIKNLSEK